MSRTPYCDKNGMRKGPWSKEEDDKLRAYIQRYGHWNWREIPRFAGVNRCGKSCRLRWMNYLRPNMKHGNFTKEEENLIMELHNKIGNKWAKIAAELPGRSDNEIKNYWHTHLKKRAKIEQNVLKNVNNETMDTNLVNPIKNSDENKEFGSLDEIEALWASLSSDVSFDNSQKYPCTVASSSESQSSSSFSSVELTSSMFSASDSLVSSCDSIQRYNNEFEANFWTDLLLEADYEGTRSTQYTSDSDLINTLMAPPASCDDMIVSDELLWSSMDFSSGYHSQFMN